MPEAGLPSTHLNVMVSSTFMDLEPHRKALIDSLHREGLFAGAMEMYNPSPDDDIISSSFRMVANGSAYIGLISQRYGQVLKDERNPNGYSVTRMEYEEALRLKRPTLVFVMSDEYPVKKASFETDAEKIKKLEEFRERVKENGRLCASFDSLEDFKVQAAQAAASLRRLLEETTYTADLAPSATNSPVPAYQPPPFRAVPAYFLASHDFQGRKTELAWLSAWAQADAQPVLLVQAIGGMGKSMLAWEWVNRYAPTSRPDWAGRFWYSFDEKGAVMADFCRQALEYMTGESAQALSPLKQPELTRRLLEQLQARPWLLVLDGLERVLMAYYRADAAQLPDAHADQLLTPGQGDSRDTIGLDDSQLLQLLTAAGPSKVLMTSRLVPSCLAGQGRAGVRHHRLTGLQPADAEALAKSLGVRGHAERLRRYLQRECAGHPLVTSVLAGLMVEAYPPDPGNFDEWLYDPQGHGQFAETLTDPAQRHGRILLAAWEATPLAGRQLLTTLALLSGAVQYPVLEILNPHLPEMPPNLSPPDDPRESFAFATRSRLYQAQLLAAHAGELTRYRQAMARWRNGQPEAVRQLRKTINDLTNRALLQYDADTKRYDLHPVVRGVAAARLLPEDRTQYGQPVIDYFASQTCRPYHEARSLDDLRGDIQRVRTLLLLGRFEEATLLLSNGLADALEFQLEEDHELLRLLQAYFPYGWQTSAPGVPANVRSYVGTLAANLLESVGKNEYVLDLRVQTLRFYIQIRDWENVQMCINNLNNHYETENRLRKAERALELVTVFANDMQDCHRFWAMHKKINQLIRLGHLREAEELWLQLDPMGRDWPIRMYRAGDAEKTYASLRWRQGQLTEADLQRAEQLAEGKNRSCVRGIRKLRGKWHLQAGRWAEAGASLEDVVRMARETGWTDTEAEAGLVLAQLQLGTLSVDAARQEAERLAQEPQPEHYALAALWAALCVPERARHHAEEAYKYAWADGEPYVRRFELEQAMDLLASLDCSLPALPPYDSALDQPLEWEDELLDALEVLRQQKQLKVKR